MSDKNRTRKQLENESESIYKTTFEAAAEGIMIADIETKRFLHVNQAICQMLGYSKDELLGMTVMDIHPKDSLEEIMTGFDAQARGERKCLTYPCLRKDGTIIYTDITAAPATIDGRECNIGFFTDVTERVFAQEALRESNENLKKAQSLAQIGDWKWTIAADKVTWSEELCNLFGYDANIPAPPFSQMAGFYTPASWKLLNEVVARAVNTGKPYEIETDQIRTDGTLIHTLTRGQADLDASGKVIGLHGTVQDITDSRKVREQLATSEVRYRRLFETAQDAILILDGDTGKIIDANPFIKDLLGYSLEELQGKNLWEIGELKDTLASKISYQQLYENGYNRWDNLPLVTRDGRNISVEVVANAYNVDHSHVIQCNIRDMTESEKSNKMLSESEMKFRILAEESPNMVFINRKGRIIYANQRCEEIMGYTKEELYSPGFDFLTLIAEEDRGKVIANLNKHMSGQDVLPYDYTLVTKNGRRLNVVLATKLIYYEDGKAIVGIITDITERKKAEEAIRVQSEMMDLQYDSVYVCDLEGNITYVNRAACLAHGYTQEEFLNMNLTDIDDPESAKLVTPRLKQILENRSATFEINHLCKNGSLIPLEAHASLIEISGKKMVMNVSHDITGRRQAQKEAEAHLQTIAKKAKEWQDTFNAVTDSVMLISPRHEFLRVNRSVAETTGKKPEELIGKKCYELMHGLSGPISGCPCLETMTTQAPSSKEIIHRGRSYIAIASPIMDENGEITALAHTIKDITDSKHMEEERNKTEKLDSVGKLAGGIAHDFNNVLTGILGNIQLARSYLKGNVKDLAEEVLSEAERESLRAKNLTQQLLTFSRGGAPIKKAMKIDSLLRESATFALRGSNISPKFTIADKLWEIEGDEGQINQVISNLVINAKQAMPSGGAIKIRATNVTIKANQIPPLPESTYVEMSIEDNGIGIPKGYFDKVFEPYFTTKQTGNGLGLATSFSIIKNHGGTITFDSELGKGTTFHVYLPAAKGKTREEMIAPSAADPTQSQRTLHGRILVMDDEDSILTLITRMLVDSGYEVETSKNGDEAVEKYSEAKKSGKAFDAVILDLTVPGGMGGKEAIAKLLEIDPDVKAIVSSGYANDPVMAHYKEYGFSGMVTKPYNINLMKEKLNSILTSK